MSVSFRAVGTWAELTADGTVAIPATPQAGDRMYLFARWKDFSITATVANWTELAEFADGSTTSGNGTGSVKVGCWYRDWQLGDADPTLDFSTSPTTASVVIIVMSKAASDSWLTPVAVTAAMTNWTTTSQIVSASSTAVVPSGGVVMGLIGIRDDTATMTRPTNGIDDAGGLVTWNGNYVEAPAAHHSTTTGDDGAADLGYRLVTTGASGVTLRMTGTISAAETGAALWVVQGIEHNLTVQNATHAHSGASASLTQVHILTAANSNHTQTATSLGVTQAHGLLVNNAVHAYASSSVTLTQVHALAVQDSGHAFVAEAVTLSVTHQLSIQDAAHAHEGGSVLLVVVYQLAVQDGGHAHGVTELALAQEHVITIDGALHTHVATSPNVRTFLITYLDPGGDPVQAVGYFNTVISAGELISYDVSEKVVGVGSYKFDSGDGTTTPVLGIAGALGASGRFSTYWRYDSVPDATEMASEFFEDNAIYSGGGFVDPANTNADDGFYATATPAKNAGQGSKCSPISPLLVPVGAVIDLVKIIYERKYDVDISVGISRVKWVVNGEEGPDHDNADMPLTDTVVEVDVTGDRGWTWQDLQIGAIEIVAEARRGDTDTAHTQSWDFVKVEVVYHEANVIMAGRTFGDGFAPFEIAVTPHGDAVVLRIADSTGNSFDGITSIFPDTWYRISFGYVQYGVDNNQFDIKLYIDSIEELSIAELIGQGGQVLNLHYGWLVAPGVDHLCWFDQLAIDNGDDLSDIGDARCAHKGAAAVNENNWNTTIGTGAVNERPLSITNGMQHTSPTAVRQTYTLQDAATGDVDISGETLLGYMVWAWAKLGGTDIGDGLAFIVNGVSGASEVATLGSSPSLLKRLVTSTAYPSDAAGVGMISNDESSDTFLYELGAVVAYEGPNINPNRILAYQVLAEGTVLDLVDDLRADPPDSYEFCYRASESETASALITVTSLDHDGGNINQQIGEFPLNGGSGRSRISAGVEVQIHIEVVGGPISIGLWHRLNVD